LDNFFFEKRKRMDGLRGFSWVNFVSSEVVSEEDDEGGKNGIN